MRKKLEYIRKLHSFTSCLIDFEQ